MAAVLDREPQVVLVDDLGAANPEGCPRRHRWEDVEVLLDRGIDVVTTLDVSQIESLADVVHRITGTPPSGTVPDEVVRGADQVELVDMAPEALRRRLAHGTLYPAEQVDAALTRYYRVGNLAALRELALLWLADRVDADLENYRRQHGIDELWATRERIVVALTGGGESEALLRRGARIASRAAGAELHAVHVSARRSRRRLGRRPGPAALAHRGAGRQLPPGDRRRPRGGGPRPGPRAQRHPGRGRREQPFTVAAASCPTESPSG